MGKENSLHHTKDFLMPVKAEDRVPYRVIIVGMKSNRPKLLSKEEVELEEEHIHKRICEKKMKYMSDKELKEFKEKEAQLQAKKKAKTAQGENA